MDTPAPDNGKPTPKKSLSPALIFFLLIAALGALLLLANMGSFFSKNTDPAAAITANNPQEATNSPTTGTGSGATVSKDKPAATSANQQLNETGTKLLEQGDVDGALQVFQKLADNNPKEPFGYYNLGVAYQKRAILIWL